MEFGGCGGEEGGTTLKIPKYTKTFKLNYKKVIQIRGHSFSTYAVRGDGEGKIFCFVFPMYTHMGL
jgi:hypothetical protein